MDSVLSEKFSYSYTEIQYLLNHSLVLGLTHCKCIVTILVLLVGENISDGDILCFSQIKLKICWDISLLSNSPKAVTTTVLAVGLSDLCGFLLA